MVSQRLVDIGGPLVAEIPSNALGMVNDFWFNYVTDLDIIGPGKGKGGTHLLLAPSYKGEVPEGCRIVPVSTFGGFLGRHNFSVNSDLVSIHQKEE